MYTLGIPDRQKRRTLGYLKQNWIDFEEHPAMEGFFDISFPGMDEDAFRDITIKLKQQGVTIIGADEVLTEKKIMKLTDLLKEQPSPDENELIDILKRTLESWEQPTYRGGLDSCEKSDHYFEDIKDIIEDYEEESGADAIAMGADDAKEFSPVQEQKLKKLIRKIIRQ
mgnify:CR=1 FL=1|tara:strand:- start:64 stop:570 length:507 start_codon:yes stop_codon:yes gene_type:complete